MRTAVLAVVVVAAVTLGGCAAERARLEKRQRDASAAALGMPSGSLLRYLSPDEREALDRVGMGRRVDPAEAAADGTTPDDLALDEGDLGAEADVDPEAGSTSETVGAVGVSVLQVGLTLGMLAAPFFLF